MLKSECLVIISFLLTIGLGSSYAQTSDNFTIKATLKEGNLQNANVSLDSESKLCPDNDCLIELEGTTFNGSALDKLLFGTVKIEDKTKSDPNFISFNYYKLAGSFHLSSSKENVKTGQKFLFYNGTLGVDQNDVIFNPEFKFSSEIKLAQNNFELNGISNQRSEINEIVKKLTQPVQENASAFGKTEANITLVEFADYQCQNCTKFHNQTESQIINNYVKTGKIKFLFKDFIVNDRMYENASTLAARASYCAADQGKYWQYHDELYNNSQGENTGWVTKESLKQFARNVTITDLGKFSECLDSQKYNELVMENNQLAEAIGLKSAPTFIFLREGREPLGIVGAQPYNIFQGAISQLEQPEARTSEKPE
jgi:protein-disulfide isomerase